jgi:hypothetical protein
VKAFYLSVISLLLLTQAVWPDAAATMRVLKAKAETAICRPPTPQCTVQFEAAVQNQLGPEEYLWAFSYTVAAQGVKSQKETQQMKEILLRLNSYALDLSSEKISAITYYREKAGAWGPLI